jgi:hypothetical protein
VFFFFLRTYYSLGWFSSIFLRFLHFLGSIQKLGSRPQKQLKKLPGRGSLLYLWTNVPMGRKLVRKRTKTSCYPHLFTWGWKGPEFGRILLCRRIVVTSLTAAEPRWAAELLEEVGAISNFLDLWSRRKLCEEQLQPIVYFYLFGTLIWS